MEKESDMRALQAGYDLATLFRVVPWILLMRDQRPPQSLVESAFRDAKGFIEAQTVDPNRDRKSLMRGLLVNWCYAMGVQPDPNMVEMLTGLVAQVVDANVTSQYSSGLSGEIA